MGSQCKCHGINVEYCDERGERICDECGRVLSSYNEEEFPKCRVKDFERVDIVGNIEDNKENTGSRLTILNNIKEIHNICQNLLLTNDVAEFAEGIYRTALLIGMTRGRRREITQGACIYMAARLKQKSIMMLDVSDIIHVSVFTLAHVYNKLKENTGTQVSDIVDPCLFIERFAAEFDLGDQTRKVCVMALRFLHRMKKDWICTGRRPSTITASALLIASRIHRFNRDCKDAARVARVSTKTIENRIQEWGNTPTSNLTLSDFLMIDFPDEYDPPALKLSNRCVEVQRPQRVSLQEFCKICKEIDDNRKRYKVVRCRNKDKGKRQMKGNTIFYIEKAKSYSTLVDSIERDMVDMEELIRAANMQTENSDDDDIVEELADRRQLLNEMLIGRPTSAITDNESVHLPLEIDDSDMQTITTGGRVWPDETTGAPCSSDIDEDQLERLYVLSKEDSLNRARWFLRQPANINFFRRQKQLKMKKVRKAQRRRMQLLSSNNRRRNCCRLQKAVEIAKTLMKPLEIVSFTGKNNVVGPPLVNVDLLKSGEQVDDCDLDSDSYTRTVTWEDE